MRSRVEEQAHAFTGMMSTVPSYASLSYVLVPNLAVPALWPFAVEAQQVLVAVGRTPNGKLLDADKAGVNVDERGFINVDKQLKTNVDNIFAIMRHCVTLVTFQ